MACYIRGSGPLEPAALPPFVHHAVPVQRSMTHTQGLAAAVLTQRPVRRYAMAVHRVVHATHEAPHVVSCSHTPPPFKKDAEGLCGDHPALRTWKLLARITDVRVARAIIIAGQEPGGFEISCFQ